MSGPRKTSPFRDGEMISLPLHRAHARDNRLTATATLIVPTSLNINQRFDSSDDVA